jgi:transcriptional regulator with XRE-family HTH domain
LGPASTSFLPSLVELPHNFQRVPKESGLMDELERAICARLKEAREERFHKVSQTEMAKLVGVSHAKWVSIEYGRTPLRFSIGDKACQVLLLSQRWLVEGKPPSRFYVLFPKDVFDKIPSTLLFSQAYLRFIKPFAERTFAQKTPAEILDAKLESEYQETGEGRTWLLQREVTNALTNLPKVEHEEFCTALENLLMEFAPDKNKVLHEFTPKGKSLGVKLTLPGLIRCLKRATAYHGAKSSLARELGVKPARITEWLNGEKEPGGAFTLEMLNWVRAWEVKQKSPGSADNTARARTRKRTSYERQTQSGPP